MGEKDEKNILEGCKKGKRHFQELLYKTYSSKMFGVCLGYATDYDSAQDLLQEGFIKVFQNIHKCSGSGSLEGWIRRVMVNNAIDHYRVQAHKFSFTELTDAHLDERDMFSENDARLKLEKDDFLKLTGTLPEGYRLVLNLFIVEEYSHKEIAKTLGITEGTSKSQLAKAKKFLRNKLEKFIDTELLETYGREKLRKVV